MICTWLLVMSGTASIGSLVALHTPQTMSASVINAMMNLFFMLNAIILSNIFLISLMNEYKITCGASAP
jgi:hypothetical protein